MKTIYLTLSQHKKITNLMLDNQSIKFVKSGKKFEVKQARFFYELFVKNEIVFTSAEESEITDFILII